MLATGVAGRGGRTGSIERVFKEFARFEGVGDTS